MSFLLTCPNCGVREVTDFGFGGEISPRPKGTPSFRELNAYNYFRVNKAGVQREWWFHRSGCRAWFIAGRNTVTNEVLFTALPGEGPGRADLGEGPGRADLGEGPVQADLGEGPVQADPGVQATVTAGDAAGDPL